MELEELKRVLIEKIAASGDYGMLEYLLRILESGDIPPAERWWEALPDEARDNIEKYEES